VLDASDWVIEIGPGAGTEGGKVTDERPGEALSRVARPTSRRLR
jgi:excinuclease UvrABC ATPase subunit